MNIGSKYRMYDSTIDSHGRHFDPGSRRFLDTLANHLILYCFKDTAAHWYKYQVKQQWIEQKIINIYTYSGGSGLLWNAPEMHESIQNGGISKESVVSLDYFAK